MCISPCPTYYRACLLRMIRSQVVLALCWRGYSKSPVSLGARAHISSPPARWEAVGSPLHELFLWLMVSKSSYCVYLISPELKLLVCKVFWRGEPVLPVECVRHQEEWKEWDYTHSFEKKRWSFSMHGIRFHYYSMAQACSIQVQSLGMVDSLF